MEPYETGGKRKFDAINRRTGANNLDGSATEFGKIPPQARDFEEAVLGAILIESGAYDEVKLTLKDDMFYVDAHRRIYKAISELGLAEAPIELLTVSEQLKKNGDLEAAGGSYYVMQLTNKVGSAANLTYHAMIIHQKWMQRSLIANSSDIIREAYEDSADPIELSAKAVESFSNISQGIRGAMNHEIQADVMKVADEMNVRRYTTDEELPPVGKETGIEPLDFYFTGYVDENLVIIAGNPSEGKSTAALQSARHACRKGEAIAIFSLEMSKKEIIQKWCAMESGVDLEKIRKARMDKHEWDRVDKAMDEIYKWKALICDTDSMDITDLISLAKIWIAKKKVIQVFVDYLQLVTVNVQTRKMYSIQNKEQVVSFISGKLKGLAKSSHVPVIALSQLSRENEKRSGDSKRPQNSDIRDSGAIEQDADVIIFVFRPEKHGISHYADQSSTEGITEFIISKNRMGPLKTVRARFRGAHSLFISMDEFDSGPKQGSLLPMEEAKKKEVPPPRFDDEMPF